MKVTLIWVPLHHGTLGNEDADKLARQASAMLLLGPEPALGILKCLAREAIENWTERKNYSAWTDLPGHRHGKLHTGRPCKKRADDLLKLNRHQLKMAVAILTGHAAVRGTCILWACLMGIQHEDSAGWRLKQCSILSAAARRWLVSAITPLGS